MSFMRRLMWLLHREGKKTGLGEDTRCYLTEEIDSRDSGGRANADSLKGQVRSVSIGTFWEKLLQDLRYARRMMRANKTFTAIAIVSLALGIGANTALYSFMDSLLLRSLPVQDPNSLVVLQWHSPPGVVNGRRPSVLHSMSGATYDDPELGDTGDVFPYLAVKLFEKNTSLFSSVFAYHPATELNVFVKGQAEVVRGEYVSESYFAGLGVPPLAGRLILSGDDDARAPTVTVVSSAFCRRHFDAASDAVGQKVLINNVLLTIVGVAHPEFFGVDPAAAPDIYLPLHAGTVIEAASPFVDAKERFLDPNDYWIEVMARLRPGVTRQRAQSILGPQFHQWVESTVTYKKEERTLPELIVQRGESGVDTLRQRYSQPLFILMILTGLILAIACANIANLLLSRTTSRQKETAVRLSLGAGRLRLIRQLLTESVLLACCGGILGLLIALWGMRSLTARLSGGRPGFTLHANLNWHVLAITAILSILTGILFGMAPAFQATRIDILPTLNMIRAGESKLRKRPRVRHALVVSQISLSLLMLIPATLFARTLDNLQAVELGFNRKNLLLFELDASKPGYNDLEVATFYADLLQRLRAIPGVLNVSLSNHSLINAGSRLRIHLPGLPYDPATRYLSVGPSFFKTMQIPLLAGRAIEERDQPDSAKVAVVSESFAKKNFGGENPLGRHIILENGTNIRDMEIVGVSLTAHYGKLNHEIPPVVYIPYNQGYPPPRSMTYEMRTTGPPLSYMNTVRELVHQADARVPVTKARTQIEDIDDTISTQIVFARLSTSLALLALIIACIGLYGTVSYNAALRTAEIGIRVALGAQRASIIWMILREVLVLAAIGLAISIPVALKATTLARPFLYGITPDDPWALGTSVLVLLGSALLAGYLPARRASHIDPMIALRHE